MFRIRLERNSLQRLLYFCHLLTPHRFRLVQTRCRNKATRIKSLLVPINTPWRRLCCIQKTMSYVERECPRLTWIRILNTLYLRNVSDCFTFLLLEAFTKLSWQILTGKHRTIKHPLVIAQLPFSTTLSSLPESTFAWILYARVNNNKKKLCLFIWTIVQHGERAGFYDASSTSKRIAGVVCMRVFVCIDVQRDSVDLHCRKQGFRCIRLAAYCEDIVKTERAKGL